jgi:hypothetical protein
MIPETYICYRPDHGFCVYHPREQKLWYTQEPLGGSEASREGWQQALSGQGLDDGVLLPSTAWASRVRCLIANNALVLSQDYLDNAIREVLAQTERLPHFPQEAKRTIKSVCKAVLARQPLSVRDHQPVQQAA